MSYKCAYGCSSYNPSCDAWDSETTSDNPYTYKAEEKILLKAALKGMTKKEYLDQEEDEL